MEQARKGVMEKRHGGRERRQATARVGALCVRACACARIVCVVKRALGFGQEGNDGQVGTIIRGRGREKEGGEREGWGEGRQGGGRVREEGRDWRVGRSVWDASQGGR